MAPAKDGLRRILPFRIPFFRVFYSLTYTVLYLLTLVFLAITPVSMLWSSVERMTLQYTFMIGSTYFLTAIIAVFIYSSRLYTNRSVLSAVGKAYIPIEDGEIGKMVRKMIVKQLQRSAIVAWEGRPRDLYAEILWGEQAGVLPKEDDNLTQNDFTVGSEITVDPSNPPWGDVQHPGWSSPSHKNDNKNPHVRFAEVVAELPNLIEARAVSLAPLDPTLAPIQDQPRAADPAVVDLLARPTNMAMREYLTQLGYLGLLQPPEIGQKFLSQYDKARYGGRPSTVAEFTSLMDTFAGLLSGMAALDPAIIHEIRAQSGEPDQMTDIPMLSLPYPEAQEPLRMLSTPPRTPESSLISPVTAREGQSSRAVTPYLSGDTESEESLGSVIHNTSDDVFAADQEENGHYPIYNIQAPSSSTLPSDVESVLVHDAG